MELQHYFRSKGIFKIPLPFRNVFLINSGVIAKELLDKTDIMHKGTNLDLLHILIGNGLLLLEGQRHRQHRIILAPSYRRPLDHNIEDIVMRELIGLPNTGILEFPQYTDRLFLRVLGRVLFECTDTDFEDFRLLAAKTLRIATHVAWSGILPIRFVSPKKERLSDLLNEWRDLINRLSTHAGIINQMIKSGFSSEEIIHESITAIMAGHETTSSAASWLVYLVTKSNYSDKLDGNIDLINQAIHETLRMYPPAWIFYRTNKEDLYVKNTFIKKESLLLISPFLIHRNIYWAEPTTFDPHRRFIENEFLPFSVGIRSCIGASMANSFLTVFCRQFYKHLQVTHISRNRDSFGIVLRPNFRIAYRRK